MRGGMMVLIDKEKLLTDIQTRLDSGVLELGDGLDNEINNNERGLAIAIQIINEQPQVARKNEDMMCMWRDKEAVKEFQKWKQEQIKKDYINKGIKELTDSVDCMGR